ncbi:MAG: hypothetical protein HYR66_04325 [Sphingobacteriales bacterium]|nr:hypothetical protein [Sphingobacteriales bacterium]MBI3718671.1 hypothetical protein [Sphingobacteriales bacterium]
MRKQHRDLLVLIKNQSHIPHSIDVEVEMLHELLYDVETMENLCVASEIIDLTRFALITKPNLVARVLRQRELKPFQFVNNKN